MEREIELEWHQQPELPTPGHHTGTIVNFEDVGVVARGKYENDTIEITIRIDDQRAADGKEIFVTVQVTKTLKLGSHLGMILNRLGFRPDENCKFKLSQALDTPVDVLVKHTTGKIPGALFAGIKPQDIKPRRRRQIATEVGEAVVADAAIIDQRPQLPRSA